MALRRPLIDLAGLAAVLLVLALVGRVLGFGPLSSVVPPDQVTDPGEMVARSVQAIMDTSAVQLAATVEGVIPGALAGRSEASIDLAGTLAQVTLRPHDAKTRLHVESPALGAYLDATTVWDSAWYRTTPDGPYAKESIGVITAGWGIDINPLTLVDRLRAYLAGVSPKPTSVDVPCASASGTCHRVTVQTGEEARALVAAVIPQSARAALPPVTITAIVDTDVLTLRPAHIDLVIASADGSVAVHVVVEASGWDDVLVIDEPAVGS